MSRKERLAEHERQVRQKVPAFDDVTVADDRGTTYALKAWGMQGNGGQADAEPRPVAVIFRLEPPPAQEAAWAELRRHDGPATRLVASPRAAVHVSDVTPVSAAERDLAGLAGWLIGTKACLKVPEVPGHSPEGRDPSMTVNWAVPYLLDMP